MTDPSRVVIVGAGPTGLTLALFLSKKYENVTVIDQESEIGGIWRVTRVGPDEVYTEHGPKVLLSAHYNYRQILQKELDLDFSDHYTPYMMTMQRGLLLMLQRLNMHEIWICIWTYFTWSWDSMRKITIGDWARKYDIRPETLDMIDRVIRAVDAGDSERCTLYFLIMMFEQKWNSNFYEPIEAGDRSTIWKTWEKVLRCRGVQFRLGERAAIVQPSEGNILLQTDTGLIIADKLIFAMPGPILANGDITGVEKCFGPEFMALMDATKYNDLVPFTIWYKERPNVPELDSMWGVSFKNEWRIFWITMSKYLMNEPGYIICCVITRLDHPSSVTGKTANDTSDPDELLAEALRQIQTELPLPPPDHIVLSPESTHNEGWKQKHGGFLPTKAGFWHKFQSRHAPNIYTVGGHCGFAEYEFNSIETAVANAMEYCRIEESITVPPAIGPDQMYPKVLTLVTTLIAIIMLIFYRMRQKKKK